MNQFDEYCNSLLEEAKRFLEIAIEKKKQEENYDVTPYLRSSLLIVFSSLEAFVSGVTEDFKNSKALTLHEKAFLEEKEITLKNGVFIKTNKLKMTRLIDRIEFLIHKFKPNSLNKNDAWWTMLNDGIKKRNSIVHPRDNEELSIGDVSRSILSVIECIDILFKSVYKRNFPSAKLGLKSRCDF